MKFMIRILSCLLLSLTLFSCATRDEVVYFQKAEDIQGMENLQSYEPIIEKNDVLNIRVSSRNEEVVKPFKMNLDSQQSGGGGNQNPSLMGYLVDPKGNIQFPVLGQIHVAGKKRTELEQDLQSQIRTMVTDAVVSIRITNFKVTVLGEVGNPGRVDVEDGRITLPELFASVGDINYQGKRENILVIRETNGVKTMGRVDITDSNVFKNPFYYLKQNDIVYVEPTYKQMKSAGFFSSYAGIFSLIGSVSGVILLLTSISK
ncbi:polysaccharide biosynthesis/export family protein [Christiangramia salexigens]|uniref:Sugar transporter n=1 Tax=Christiangramia salexigens TaxID=1913577 RepID=A0A1L3J2E4_9FLAO|nr:polysaccharide biosynthesis/export family protein [Christiangramia salexigens]APG59295.1 sugar transporter [Christiangramia salexigens]